MPHGPSNFQARVGREKHLLFAREKAQPVDEGAAVHVSHLDLEPAEPVRVRLRRQRLCHQLASTTARAFRPQRPHICLWRFDASM
eukprot:359932-Rhodomonas_salina.2